MGRVHKSATTIYQQMFFLFPTDINSGHRITIEKKERKTFSVFEFEILTN